MTGQGATKTTRRTRIFRRPFQIGKDAQVYLAGPYDILTTEAAHEGNERVVYVRISTVLLIKSLGTTTHREVLAEDLEEAIRQDDWPWAKTPVPTRDDLTGSDNHLAE